MLSRASVVEKALELGFADIGFTSADPFDSQKEILQSRKELYDWALPLGLDLMQGVDPRNILPRAETIIVLLENYMQKSYPASMTRYFGRCYLDDDRVTKQGLSRRIKHFCVFLGQHGINAKVPFNVPHRLAAARAGLGTLGKNNLLYANRAAARSSWVLPLAIVIDGQYEPDEPTMVLGCPDWCRNACITACPTGALMSPQKINPRRCISYLTYYGDGITPLELREPMGTWVYGCDHCQNVCPRNRAWMSRELPLNEKVSTMVEDFRLQKLLRMDTEYFQTRIWPHMFYMEARDIWRWQMNAARAMGNSLDEAYVPELSRALRENQDERVRCMSAWALGRIGGPRAREELNAARVETYGRVREELELALGRA